MSVTTAPDLRPGPLAGFRVLDLIDDGAAFGPKLLAGLGAEVVRIEPPGGARHRRRAPFCRNLPGAEDASSLYFLHYNSGKKGITLDVSTTAGRALLGALLEQVDCVFDNGELDRLGFCPEALTARSSLVVVSVTPFGLRSARADWRGGDLIVQALSGMANLFGFRDERPARLGPEQAFEMSGLAAALGALVALFAARHGGGGDLVDIAMQRVCALVTFQVANASVYHQFGVQRERTPREKGLHGTLYATRDGHVAFGAYRDAAALVSLLKQAGAAADLPELLRTLPHEEFVQSPYVEEVVRRYAAGLTRAEFVAAVQAHGQLALPVNDAADLLSDPFLQGRAYFAEVEHRELGRLLKDAGPPMRFSATPYRPGRRAPLPGEDNDEVLSSGRWASGSRQSAVGLNAAVVQPPVGAHAMRPTVADLHDTRPTAPPATTLPHSSSTAYGRDTSRHYRLPGAPLSGVRILDLSWIIAGPLASRLLADFGADVIKIESASRADSARGNKRALYGPLPVDVNDNPDTGGYFQDTNAGKRSCTLDLTLPEGRELLRQLVRVSDAIVCNLGGDQLERWGIGYAQARELNPGIIVVNMPTMESTGPRRRWRGYGDMIASAAGLKSVSGNPEDGPLPFGHHYPDFAANPFHAALALLAALHHRERTGEGQFVEVSQYESTVALMGTTILDYTANVAVPGRRGNRDPLAAPHNVYRCRGEDAWCAIAVYDDDQWRTLAAIEGLEALRRPEYASLAGRKQHEEAIDTAIEAWTVDRERQELAAFLQARGVPARMSSSMRIARRFSAGARRACRRVSNDLRDRRAGPRTGRRILHAVPAPRWARVPDPR